MAQTTARRFGLGLWALVVALVGIVVLTFLPTSFVIQRPGPVFDTLGSARATDGSEIPLISIDGTVDYADTAGTLRLTTIQIQGSRERRPSWFELALAWLDPARDILPLDLIFPQGETSAERNERNAALMDESQNEATAAALRKVGFEVPAAVEVMALQEGAPAEGILEEGDELLAAAGHPLTSTSNLRARVQESNGAPIVFTMRRAGVVQDVTVIPQRAGDGGPWVIGAYVVTHYDFPVEVTIQLDNVGGPSAGLMFALGIIDRLTPGHLTGGAEIAGTGTIDSEGVVGPIGGIRQKMHGARDAGSTYFFAPESNCDEVVGHIPGGLQVIRTATLDDALAALQVIASDGDTASLPSCSGGLAQ